MESWHHLLLGFSQFQSFPLWSLLFLGVFLGIIAGAMPGLSPSTAVALLVPFSYSLEPTSALIFLTAIYISTNYGGSITAILMNTPGTPASAVTALDGYELTKKGQAPLALKTALLASTVGGGLGVVALILFTKPLAAIALKFSSFDYFALAIFALTTLVAMNPQEKLKTLLSVLLGLLIKTIGIDPITGVSRFTFGLEELEDGIHMIPALIGLFAISIVFENLFHPSDSSSSNEGSPSHQPLATLKIWTTQKWVIIKSSLLGTVIGIFPGAGSTVASFMSYGWSKKSSSTPQEFGHGSLEGVAASESANSSSVGGALIPLLALGIPGSATDAVLMGAFALHDLTPGPLLLTQTPHLVYGIFAGLLLANIIMYLMGSLGAPLFAKITQIPQKILTVLILLFSLVGSFAYYNSSFDMLIALLFGLLGWILKSLRFPVAPVVLGLVLGTMIEENLRRALLMEGMASFYKNPIGLTLLTLSVVSLIPFARLKR